jgi:quercetin dioxygenase-like cupin family protein
MSNLSELKSIAPQTIWDGVSARSVKGERLTLAIIELEPGGHVPEHHHDNEQLGVVLQGTVTFRVGDQSRELGPGGTWRVLGGVPHEVRVGEQGAVVAEAFAPARADWEEIERESPREPRWP